MSIDAMDQIVKNVKAKPEQYMGAMSLGMSRWRTVWVVVIKGTRYETLTAIRQCAAITWASLTTAEGLVRGALGIGNLILDQDRTFSVSQTFALQFLIFITGLIFIDLIFQHLIINPSCAYANIELAKKRSRRKS